MAGMFSMPGPGPYLLLMMRAVGLSGDFCRHRRVCLSPFGQEFPKRISNLSLHFLDQLTEPTRHQCQTVLFDFW